MNPTISHDARVIHFILGIVGEATLALLLLPTPDTFSAILTLAKCPRAYVVFYSCVRYVANLNVKAGWQESKPTPLIQAEALMPEPEIAKP